MSAHNRPGAVHALLEPLARHGVSMTRLRIASGAHRPVGVPVLRRPRRPSRRRTGRGGAGGARAHARRFSSCWVVPGGADLNSGSQSMSDRRKRDVRRSRPTTCAASRPTCRASRSRSSRANTGSSKAGSSSSPRTRIRAGRARRCARRSPPRRPTSRAIRTATASRSSRRWRRASASALEQIVLGNGSQRHPRARDAGVPAPRRRRRLLAACVRRVSARDAGARRDRASKCRRAISATICAAMRAAITPRTRIVFVANPNNPTGTWLAAGRRARRSSPRCRATCWSCSTRRTTNISSRRSRRTARRWIATHPNLLVSRTFSKAYGLAGLRVGYGIADAGVADMLNRVRQPFNVNSLAQAAAIAALADNDYVAESRALNRDGLAQLDARARCARRRVCCRRTATSCWSTSATRRAPVYEALLRAGRDRAPGRQLRPARHGCASPSDCRRRTRAFSRRSAPRSALTRPCRRDRAHRQARRRRRRPDRRLVRARAERRRRGRQRRRRRPRPRQSRRGAARWAIIDRAYTLDEAWTARARRRRPRAARHAGRRKCRRCSPRSRRIWAPRRSSPTPAAPSRT